MDDGSDHEHAVDEADEEEDEYDEDEEMEGARTRRQSDVDMD
jgi:protein-serine/threonine kinase